MPLRSIWATRRAPSSNEGEAEAPRRTRGSGSCERLGRLREQGVLSDEEVAAEKQRLLGTPA